ncbi:unnamed protein product, partial [Polarella glacialis]
MLAAATGKSGADQKALDAESQNTADDEDDDEAFVRSIEQCLKAQHQQKRDGRASAIRKGSTRCSGVTLVAGISEAKTGSLAWASVEALPVGVNLVTGLHFTSHADTEHLLEPPDLSVQKEFRLLLAHGLSASRPVVALKELTMWTTLHEEPGFSATPEFDAGPDRSSREELDAGLGLRRASRGGSRLPRLRPAATPGSEGTPSSPSCGSRVSIDPERLHSQRSPNVNTERRQRLDAIKQNRRRRNLDEEIRGEWKDHECRLKWERLRRERSEKAKVLPGLAQAEARGSPCTAAAARISVGLDRVDDAQGIGSPQATPRQRRPGSAGGLESLLPSREGLPPRSERQHEASPRAARSMSPARKLTTADLAGTADTVSQAAAPDEDDADEPFQDTDTGRSGTAILLVAVPPSAPAPAGRFSRHVNTAGTATAKLEPEPDADERHLCPDERGQGASPTPDSERSGSSQKQRPPPLTESEADEPVTDKRVCSANECLTLDQKLASGLVQGLLDSGLEHVARSRPQDPAKLRVGAEQLSGGQSSEEGPHLAVSQPQPELQAPEHLGAGSQQAELPVPEQAHAAEHPEAAEKSQETEKAQQELEPTQASEPQDAEEFWEAEQKSALQSAVEEAKQAVPQQTATASSASSHPSLVVSRQETPDNPAELSEPAKLEGAPSAGSVSLAEDLPKPDLSVDFLEKDKASNPRFASGPEVV